MSELDDLDEDFNTRPTQEVIAERLVHGESRRTVASELGITLQQVHGHVAQAVRDWSGAAGTPRERLTVLYMQLDDITSRVYAELSTERGYYDLQSLLSLLVEVSKLRAGLLTAERHPHREGPVE